MPSPRVSVLLPVYNAARYLREALQSIQAQTLQDFECIVVDDGSTDDSRLIADTFARKDARFSLFPRSNTGIVGALNDGLSLCHAEYVARMDADDVAMPGRLAKQVAFLDAHPKTVALGTWVLFTDPKGRPLLRYRPPADESSIVQELRRGTIGGLIHPSMMMRSRALRAIGAYREEAQWVEDFDLFLRLSEVGHLAILPELLLHYRQHPQSVNRTKNQQERLQRKQSALDDYFARQGLPSHTLTNLYQQKDTDLEWAFWSASEGFYGSALQWGGKALLRHPARKESWRCMNYIIKRRLGLIPGANT